MSAGHAAAVRTALFRLLLRPDHPERLRRLHQRGWMRPIEAALVRGELRITGGAAVGLRLSAAQFPYWGGQAYGVLTGQHELMVQEALRRQLGPGRVFIDVGCNIGMHTLLGARLVGPTGRVVALDPQPENVRATQANVQLNGFETVTVLEAAAAAVSGETEVIVTADSLWTRLASVSEHPLEVRRERVSAVALDELTSRLGLERTDLVKIDVEGGELEVVRGMSGLLAEHRPVIVCEMHGKNGEFCDLMQESGYTVVNLEGPDPVATAGPDVHALAYAAG